MEDRLDGAGNFVPWKARILLVLEENELWDEVVNHTTAHPIVIPNATTNLVVLAAFNKDIKARRIILDAVKDHVIPHILSKDRAHKMWVDQIILELKRESKYGFEGEVEKYQDGRRGGCDILPC